MNAKARKTLYALYQNGDVIGVFTLEEIAKKLNISPKTVRRNYEESRHFGRNKAYEIDMLDFSEEFKQSFTYSWNSARRALLVG